MTDLIAHLSQGFAIALTPMNLLFGFIGVVLGTAVGVLPGIGPAVAISLLLPTTFGLEPTTAFIMFGGIYYGSMYGGSTTSILVNTPGDAASAVTTHRRSADGAQRARGRRADHVGDRIVRRRHGRHRAAHAAGADARRRRAALRAARVLRADGARADHGGRARGRFAGARGGGHVHWPAAGDDRHRPPDRASPG